MGIRIYNPKTQRWELQTSLHATSIAVRDTEGNFKEENNSVEDCLKEVKQDIGVLKKDIKYIYENGTIGGGSGGGGGAFPKIELNGSNNIIVRSENTFNISYFFNSPNTGDGTANYVISKKGSLDAPIVDVTKSVKQGRNNYQFDPIPSGEYELTISVRDSQGIGSNVLIVNITCGALELITNESLNQDVDLSTEISVTYTLKSIFKEDADVIITMPDGKKVTEKKSAGTYTIELGRMESLGVKSLTIEASVNDVISNKLKFNFIVTDSSNMFITTNFEGGEFRTDEVVNLNYRISLVGARKFLTDVYLDGQLHEENISSNSGHNFYALTGLDVGEHYVTFKCRTLESVNPIRGEITLPKFTVVSSEFRSYVKSTDSLVISLDARKGKSNNQSPEIRSVWEDTEEGVETKATLHGFAFNHINGWVPSEDGTVKALTFAGKSYVDINLKPLKEQITNGLTIEIRHRSFDTGNRKANTYNYVLDIFRDEKSNGKGIMIDVKEAFARNNYADSVNSEFEPGQWITHTFVLNRKDMELIMYTNGCISSYAKINKAADMLVDKTITLGARRNSDGTYSDNANCEIQTFRMYNRALTDEEVFKNYVSDLPLEEQDSIIAIHEGQSQIPTLRLKFDESALSSATATTPVDIEYTDPSDPSKNLILYNSIIQKQGTTSLTYPVSNYTINLYDGGLPYDYSPKDEWVPENIFTLKADYMDSSHANNTGIAAYTTEVFKRLGIKNLAQKENPNVQNTIRGFMVNLYINGTHRGLYNFNTDRYGAKNYGLSSTSYKTTAVSYEAAANTGDATGFHTTDWNKIKSAFKVRYFKGETDSSKYMTFDRDLQQWVMTQGTHKELEKLIKWIHDTGTDSNNLFYSEFKEHIDLNHALIYMLTVEIFGLMDNLEKNMVLTYFGEQYNSSTGAVDEIWYPQLYDMDSSVGLSNNGELKYQPCVNFTQEEGMPSDHQYNGTTSLLWANIKKHFIKELKDMYSQMRRTGLLNIDTLMRYYQGETVDRVSPYLFSVDSRLKYISPSSNSDGSATYYHFCKGRRIEFTRKWLSQRISFLDSVYEYGNENNPDGNFWKYIQARYLKNNSVDQTFDLQVKTTSPLFLLTVDDSMNPQGKKTFVSNDKYYTIKVPINSAADGAMFGITFGPNIRDLKFGNNIRLLSMYLEHGESIVELNIPDNRDLTTITLDNCKSLQYFNAMRCTKLGTAIGSENIDFTNCPNIREINFQNTGISGFTLSPNGGILDKLVCDNSDIETFVLKNQSYISEINLDNCRNLRRFEVEGCNNINQIVIPQSSLEVFRVTDCTDIKYVNISNTPYLNCNIDPADPEGRANFLIDNCSKLEKVIMSGLNNKDMTWLDLINVENIKYLDITKCGYLGDIRFSEACNSLETLLCNDSFIKSFRFGRSASEVNYLDFANFPKIKSVNFNNCANLRELKNINFGRETPVNAVNVFRNCVELTKISGYLRLGGAMTQTFYNCKKLVSLPNDLVLSDVTSMHQTFCNCLLINLNEAKRIMSKLINIVNSTWAFQSCTGINTESFPEDFFRYNSKLTSITGFFSGCSNIRGEFPVRLFEHLPSLTSLAYPFSGCKFEVPLIGADEMLHPLTELKTIDSPFAGMTFNRMPNKKLLEKCTKLTSIYQLFRDHSYLSKNPDSGEHFIEEDYFSNNPLITNACRTFYGCRGLTGTIPENLFINQPNITTFEGTFHGCSGLIGSIPQNLLYNQHKITNTESMFYGCSGLTGSIPEEFIPTELEGGVQNSKLIEVNYMFKGCSGLTRNIPNSLFENHRRITQMVGVFEGCTNLSTDIDESEKQFPKRLFRNKVGLLSVHSCFKGCTNLRLDMIPGDKELEDMFIDNKFMTTIDELFSGCINIYGTIPPLMFSKKDESGRYIPNKIVNAINVFNGCSNITGGISGEMFKSFYDITDLTNFFYGCYRIEGGIPYDLFYNCSKLKKVSGMFGECYSLNKHRDHDIDKCYDEELGITYLFHKDLFLYNPKLEDVSRFLIRYYDAGLGYGLSGTLHSQSFFGNPELKFLDNTFRGLSLNADLNGTLFSKNSKITNLKETFRCSGTITITPDFIRSDIHNFVYRDSNGNVVPKDFSATFAGNKMTGTAPLLWEMYPDAKTEAENAKTFTGTNIDNIDSVPAHWK